MKNAFKMTVMASALATVVTGCNNSVRNSSEGVITVGEDVVDSGIQDVRGEYDAFDFLDTSADALSDVDAFEADSKDGDVLIADSKSEGDVYELDSKGTGDVSTTDSKPGFDASDVFEIDSKGEDTVSTDVEVGRTCSEFYDDAMRCFEADSKDEIAACFDAMVPADVARECCEEYIRLLSECDSKNCDWMLGYAQNKHEEMTGEACCEGDEVLCTTEYFGVAADPEQCRTWYYGPTCD